jgi:hypothetical protein
MSISLRTWVEDQASIIEVVGHIIFTMILLTHHYFQQVEFAV